MRSAADCIPGAFRADDAWCPLPAAAHYGIEARDLFEHGHRAGVAKFVAVELACRLTTLTGRAVGAHYGGISSAAVSRIPRKIREGKYDLADIAESLQAAIRKAEAGWSES